MAQVADNATAHGLLTDALNALVDGIDVGSSNSYGQLVITDTDGGGGTDIVAIDFADPAYAAAAWDAGNSWADAALTGGSAISGTATASDTAAGFRIIDKDENILFTGSVGTSGADINLNNVNITNGQTVTITALEFRLTDGS
jgi:hypothetical protein